MTNVSIDTTMAKYDPLPLIPKNWKDAVCRILEENRPNSVMVTSRARLDWESTFPDTFEFQRNEAIIHSLRRPDIEGRRIYGMTENGEVWQFWTIYRNRQIFTKINLLPNNQVVIVYSTHPPLKGNSL